jgi:hypothetical protein
MAYTLGIFDAPDKMGCAYSTSCINPATHTKKGRLNLNHPLMDVASKMPLLISLLLPTKAEHNSRKMHEPPRSRQIK